MFRVLNIQLLLMNHKIVFTTFQEPNRQVVAGWWQLTLKVLVMGNKQPLLSPRPGASLCVSSASLSWHKGAEPDTIRTLRSGQTHREWRIQTPQWVADICPLAACCWVESSPPQTRLSQAAAARFVHYGVRVPPSQVHSTLAFNRN